ncbi:hypothetical protein BGZ75_009630 [Mortierella antarctica]|nr:hypothetical protein BGZ75_009630 [Mortierella antarctica]
MTTQVVSQATVEALGDLLLESASMQSALTAHEQRRKHSYKSNALISKTMRQSQEERRKIALTEQAKKRYQFTNHARKLALFASGEPSDGSSGSEEEDQEEEEEDEDEEDEGNNDGDERDNEPGSGTAKKKKRSGKSASPSETGQQHTGMSDLPQGRMQTHKRRLSSGSEAESISGLKKEKSGNHIALSPKKPRLQTASPKPSRKRKKNKNPFRDQLMIPEPMTEIPLDLDTSYYIVPLPIGHRCFIISADGKTMARLPSGQLLVSPFESCLPAGSSHYRGNRRSDYCILDCVYSSVTRTFWTLDIMCWRGHPVYECETEFRFWWLRGKLAEIESLQAKWVATQTKEWEQDLAKKRQKKAKQIKRRHEKAAAAAASMNTAPAIPPLEADLVLQEEVDDGDDEAGTEGMDMEDSEQTDTAPSTTTAAARRKFWPIVFTPLPYFNASVDLVRLLAESMYQPTPLSPLATQTATHTGGNHATSTVIPSLSLTTLSQSLPVAPEHYSATSSSTPIISASAACHHSATAASSSASNKLSTPGTHASRETRLCGTMALSGEIATAASLFPAHDAAQVSRQNQALASEHAAGLVFFNKKTMAAHFIISFDYKAASRTTSESGSSSFTNGHPRSPDPRPPHDHPSNNHHRHRSPNVTVKVQKLKDFVIRVPINVVMQIDASRMGVAGKVAGADSATNTNTERTETTESSLGSEYGGGQRRVHDEDREDHEDKADDAEYLEGVFVAEDAKSL